ncbi:MAG: phage tail tube protein [Neptuniibacter sp.]
MTIASKLYFDIPGLGRVYGLPGSTFDPGGEKRDAVISDGGVEGFTEETVAPSIQAKLANRDDLSLDVLRNLKDVNVNIQDNAGKSWVMRGAWTAEPPKVSGGEIDLQMFGLEAVPVA